MCIHSFRVSSLIVKKLLQINFAAWPDVDLRSFCIPRRQCNHVLRFSWLKLRLPRRIMKLVGVGQSLKSRNPEARAREGSETAEKTLRSCDYEAFVSPTDGTASGTSCGSPSICGGWWGGDGQEKPLSLIILPSSNATSAGSESKWHL